MLLKNLKLGQRFRFIDDPENIVRTVTQIGTNQVYCPHNSSEPYEPEQEVYWKWCSIKVILIEEIELKKFSDWLLSNKFITIDGGTEKQKWSDGYIGGKHYTSEEIIKLYEKGK